MKQSIIGTDENWSFMCLVYMLFSKRKNTFILKVRQLNENM